MRLEDSDFQLSNSSVIELSTVANLVNVNDKYGSFLKLMLAIFTRGFLLYKGGKQAIEKKTYERKSLIKESRLLQKLCNRWPITYNDEYKRLRNKLNKILK